MKLIFLDIDGVLNRRDCYFKGNRDKWGVRPSPECVAALNLILTRTDARIVVSSAWRIGKEVEYLQEMLTDWGVAGSVIGKTPKFIDQESEHSSSAWTSTPRGAEIQSWLTQFGEYKVESFVILDDENDMAHLLPHLVQTSFDSGLLVEHADRAIALLEAA